MSLTTHVLDTARGCGAAGMRVEARRMGSGELVSHTLDAGGRATLLPDIVPGVYEISFHAGDYLGAAGFYDVIPVRCKIDDPEQHYHVPLILSPFGYSTYRGG